MYSLKQNKKIVSRHLGDETRQKVEKGSIGRSSIYTINHHFVSGIKPLQLTQMSDDKIKALKELPVSFNGITLFHGDDRDYLEEIGISTVNTSRWGEKDTREGILASIPKAIEDQKMIYDVVKELSLSEFRQYIFDWIFRPNVVTPYDIQGKKYSLVKPFGFFNGCCCCLEKENAQGRYTYEIVFNEIFTRVKYIGGSALYEGNNGTKLQFAMIKSSQGEVDILSPVNINHITKLEF